MLGWPQQLVAGQPARVLYNSAVGPLEWLQFDDGQAPTLRFGTNGWAHGSQDVLVRTPRPPASAFTPKEEV